MPIEIVPRHVHLSAKAWEILFGKKVSAKVLRPLSQRGQAVYRQSVKIVGPNGELEDVRVLGGVRKQTQVELTETEAAALGIKPVWRLSGRLSRSAGCKLIGPAGKLIIKSGVIIPISHLHLNNRDADVLALRQGQEIELNFVEDKEAQLKAVVRIHPSFRAILHITSEEAAKFWPSSTEKVKL
ncbi:MAG: PduL/EutD family phosphate acyltransferase [Patescibacteria group bacterium]